MSWYKDPLAELEKIGMLDDVEALAELRAWVVAAHESAIERAEVEALSEEDLAYVVTVGADVERATFADGSSGPLALFETRAERRQAAQLVPDLA